MLGLKPHYDLVRLKKLLSHENTRHITRSSITTAVTLGFSVTEMIDVALSLIDSNFYKSMPSDHNHRIWQDVYKAVAKKTNLYIKLQENPADKGVIISFKENTGRG